MVEEENDPKISSSLLGAVGIAPNKSSACAEDDDLLFLLFIPPKTSKPPELAPFVVVVELEVKKVLSPLPDTLLEEEAYDVQVWGLGVL